MFSRPTNGCWRNLSVPFFRSEVKWRGACRRNHCFQVGGRLHQQLRHGQVFSRGRKVQRSKPLLVHYCHVGSLVQKDPDNSDVLRRTIGRQHAVHSLGLSAIAANEGLPCAAEDVLCRRDGGKQLDDRPAAALCRAGRQRLADESTGLRGGNMNKTWVYMILWSPRSPAYASTAAVLRSGLACWPRRVKVTGNLLQSRVRAYRAFRSPDRQPEGRLLSRNILQAERRGESRPTAVGQIQKPWHPSTNSR